MDSRRTQWLRVIHSLRASRVESSGEMNLNPPSFFNRDTNEWTSTYRFRVIHPVRASRVESSGKMILKPPSLSDSHANDSTRTRRLPVIHWVRPSRVLSSGKMNLNPLSWWLVSFFRIALYTRSKELCTYAWKDESKPSFVFQRRQRVHKCLQIRRGEWRAWVSCV